MSFDFSNFDASAIEPSTSYDLLPAGTYTAMITASEMKPTKTGGERLNLTFQVAEGEHQGRLVWAGLNLKNSNEQAVQIAMRELSAICRAVGVLTPKASSELHDKPLKIKVKVRPAQNGYDASNEVSGYEPLGGGSAPAQAPAQTGGAVPPWKVGK